MSNETGTTFDDLSTKCKNCGCSKGSHLAGAYDSKFYGRSFPKGYCPGHEGRMDWDKGPGTTFKSEHLVD